MAAYFIVLDHEVLDQESVVGNAADIAALIESQGGRYLMRGAPAESLGPGPAPEKVTVCEFESVDAMKAALEREDVAELRMRRREISNSTTLIIEGI